MIKRRFTFGLCGLLTILVTAARADATPLLADFVSLGRAEIVSVAGVRTGTFWAGELNWTWYSPTPSGWDDVFYSYCVDVLKNATRRQSFEIGEMSDKPETFPLVADGTLRAAWLLNEYGAQVHALAPTAGGNAAAAGLQLAIWEVLYDTDFNLLTAPITGGFRVTSASTGALAAATGYLNDVALASQLTVDAIWLDSVLSTGQDQITRTPVPEPGTLVLLAAALAGLSVRRRRIH